MTIGLKHFLDVEHRQTKAFATAAEDAVLRFRGTLFERADGLQHFCRIGIGRKRRELEFVIHHEFQAKRRTARKSSSRVNGFVT